ncbi:MAG: class IV adenylate cyclase [Ignavibacteriaceae bacterium]
MGILNFEFKARTASIRKLEEKLAECNPVFKGEDQQTDTYFNIDNGRLKLREGRIENSLIYYERNDVENIKRSDVLLYKLLPDKSLKDILIKVHGVKVVVEKIRRIYYIDNIKFHFDEVHDLGTFVEVEAIDNTGKSSPEKLKEQCEMYFTFFGIDRSDLIDKSYSDMILDRVKL